MSWFAGLMEVALPDGRRPSELATLVGAQLEDIARVLSGRPGATVTFGAASPWCEVLADAIHLPDPMAVPAARRGRAMAVSLAFLLHECEHLRLDRDRTLPAAAWGARPDAWGPTAQRIMDWRLRWGWRFSVLWEVAVDIRVDRSARRDFPWAMDLLRDADESLHWRDGDPRPLLARMPPLTQVRDVVLLVGREVCAPSTLLSPLREVLEAAPAFLPMLDATGDVELADRVAELLTQLADLARRPKVNAAVAFARAFFDDALSPTPPPLRCGCLGSHRDPDPDRAPSPRAPPGLPMAASFPRYEVATRAHDRVRTFTTHNRAALRPAFRSLPKRLPRAVQRLLDEVLARAERPGRRRLVGAQEQGAALDPAAWPTIASRAGDGAVWLDAVRVRAPELALVILVDQSGSMSSPMGGTTRIAVARCFAAALHHALGDVPHAVVGFTTRPDAEIDWSAIDAKVAGGGFEGCVRVRKALAHTVFKRFEDDDAAAIAALDAADGLNYDAEALWFAHGMLEGRAEQHKILVVLSDGHPSRSTRESAGATELEALRETVRAMERAGIRVLGVGLQSEAVRDYYDDAIVLTS